MIWNRFPGCEVWRCTHRGTEFRLSRNGNTWTLERSLQPLQGVDLWALTTKIESKPTPIVQAEAAIKHYFEKGKINDNI